MGKNVAVLFLFQQDELCMNYELYLLMAKGMSVQIAHPIQTAID